MLCFVVCEPFGTDSEQIDEIGHNHGFYRGAPENLYICLWWLLFDESTDL